MDYEKQYQEYLARVEKALEAACETYLPEGSDVCKAARYSLMGGGKRIRAVLVLAVCDMLHGNAEAAEQFARIEGILPAPESSYAIRVAIDEAVKCRETGEEKTIVFGLTGTGYFDMVAYEKFHDGKMTDYIPSDADLQKGFDGIPQFPGNEI